MVNESMAYVRVGEKRKADESLQKALKAAPENPAANFDMGPLKAEENDSEQAEMDLREAVKADPQMALLLRIQNGLEPAVRSQELYQGLAVARVFLAVAFYAVSNRITAPYSQEDIRMRHDP